MSLPFNKTFLNESSEKIISTVSRSSKPSSPAANANLASTLSKEIQAPDTVLADCLKACGLTLADLELNNMSCVIKEALEMPGCRY